MGLVETKCLLIENLGIEIFADESYSLLRYTIICCTHCAGIHVWCTNEQANKFINTSNSCIHVDNGFMRNGNVFCVQIHCHEDECTINAF